jgi:beta-amylase
MQPFIRDLSRRYHWLIPLMGVLSTLIALSVAARPVGSLATAGVMAPLDIRDDAARQEFQRLLGEAKGIGVDTVSVDVWWGKVEKDGDQQFDWSYYDQVFDRIRQAGLKIVPILSFHKCGGGPGDDCHIPMPGWLWSAFTAEGLTANDLEYESETGAIQDDALAPGRPRPRRCSRNSVS